jgi:subtilisin family serine protease
MVGATLLAFGGVVLAQNATPDRPTTTPSSDREQQRSAEDLRPDHYIVVLKDDAPSARAVAEEHARNAGARVSHVYEHALKGYAAYIPAAALDRVKNHPRVDFAEQDYAQEAFAQELPKGVNRIDGELSPTAKIDNKDGNTNDGQRVNADVAVLDTGIYKHADLNVVGGYNCTSSTRSAWSDGNGHGTHVAGTVGAKDNTTGVVGVAPGARVWAMKVLDNSGSGYTSWIICGIDRVTQHNDPRVSNLEDIEVANMSLGGAGDNTSICGEADSYHNAICNSVNGVYGGKGVTYAVAAGNTGGGFGGTVPATYDEVLTVTAMADTDGKPGGTWSSNACRTDEEDTAANFSSFTNTRDGNTDPDHTIAAPGVCIKSTWKGGGYNTISGTSMASPHVAGTAALCIASGKCTGVPSDIMKKLRDDAKTKTGEMACETYTTDPTKFYGFKDDPNCPKAIDDTKNRYYGYVMYAGGY